MVSLDRVCTSCAVFVAIMQRLAQRRSARCRYVRHPGYLGWLLWVTGTQALLCNPLCLLSFPFVVRTRLNPALQVEPTCTTG